MRAVKLVGPGTLQLVDVEVPEPGPGEVRVKVAGAGLCHSDLHVLEFGEAWPFFGGTVGHEGAGWVDALGPGVTGLAEGDAVRVVDGPFSNFSGTIEEVQADKQKVRVQISIFGRATPVTLDFMQVEKT